MVKPFQPTQFGRYLLTERLAIGGMAEIFQAKVFGALGFEKALVIKRILPQLAEDTDFLRMFITEAKLVCHLEHPNIVQVHELGEGDGQYYIAMEYVNGADARQLWRSLAKRRQRLPGVLALFIVAEFLKGLDYAHRAVGQDGNLLGVVHRDVSPSNILISFRGDVKIGDFGIALVQQESKTQAGVLKGKFGYMSPEQVAGLAVDHRSDIFAAGIVLAELLLGRRLFLGSSDFETLDKVMNVRLDVLEEHESALPPEAVRIVRQSLQRDVNDRYQSAREFYESITDYLYREGHRITNETLAAFMAEHVTPYLDSGCPDADSGSHSAAASAASRSASGRRSSSGSHSSPVVSSQIIPDATELDRRSSQSFNLPDEQPVAGEALHPPADHPGGSAGRATLDAPGSFDGTPPGGPMLRDESGDVFEAMQTGTFEERGGQLAQDAILPAGDPAADRFREPVIAHDERPPSTAIPLDDPAFGSMPMLDIGDDSDDELRLDGEAELPDEQPSHNPMSYNPVEGAGEELDLGNGEEEEDFYLPPTPSMELAQFERAAVLTEGQLSAAQREEEGGDADFLGDLAARTVAKVLFRFSIVNESGLLVLTGRHPAGEHAELLEWINTIQLRVGAKPTATTSGRTCEIHLMEGQPHLASADRSEEALIAYLVRSDVLSRHRVEIALKNNPHRRPIAALLAAGALAPLQVSRHVTAFVHETVLDTFNWAEGNFAFYRDREFSDESFPTGMGLVELLHRGVANLGESFLEQYFQQLSGYNVVANRTPPMRLEHFEPDQAMLELYRTLDTARMMEDALATCSAIAGPLRGKQALYLFIECELASLA